MRAFLHAAVRVGGAGEWERLVHHYLHLAGSQQRPCVRLDDRSDPRFLTLLKQIGLTDEQVQQNQHPR